MILYFYRFSHSDGIRIIKIAEQNKQKTTSVFLWLSIIQAFSLRVKIDNLII